MKVINNLEVDLRQVGDYVDLHDDEYQPSPWSSDYPPLRRVEIQRDESAQYIDH